MKINISRVLCLVLVLAMMFTLAACGKTITPEESGAPAQSEDGFAAEPYITLKWADHNSDGCETAKSMDVMAEAVYEATQGRVKIEMYHGGVLGSFADSISMVENGICDIVWTSVSMFAGYFPYSEVFQLPMLGYETAQDYTDAWWDMMEAFPEIYEYEMGDYILWMAHACPAASLGVNTSVNSLADLKGLNLRAAAGPVASMATLWGANPVSMSPADMYLGMQKGVIDGYLFDGAGINTWGLAELSETILDFGLSTSMAYIFINEDAWNKITPEDQEIIMEVGRRVGSQTGATYMQNEADTLFANFEGDYRFIGSDDPLYNEFREPLTSMYAEWVETMNAAGYTSVDAQEVLDFVLERAAAYAG